MKHHYLFLAGMLNISIINSTNGLSALYLSVSGDAISEVLKSFLIRPYEFLKLLLFWYFGEKITQSDIDTLYLDPNMPPEMAQNLHALRTSMQKIVYLQNKLDRVLIDIEKLKKIVIQEKAQAGNSSILQKIKRSMSSNNESKLLHLHREVKLLETQIHAFKLCARSAQHYLEHGESKKETLSDSPLPKIASKEELDNLIMNESAKNANKESVPYVQDTMFNNSAIIMNQNGDRKNSENKNNK